MVFEKKCLVILAFIHFAFIIGFGYSLPSATPLLAIGNATNGRSTTPTTVPPSSITSSAITSTIAITPNTPTTTKKSRFVYNKTTTTTTTTTPVPSSTTTNKDAEYAGKNSGKTSKEESNNAVIIACSISGVILFILLVIVGLLVWRCLKKRAAARSKPSDPSQQQQQIDGPMTATTDFKKTQTTPISPLKPWAPEHIPAETFAYKGPLVLQTKPPSEIQMVHELDNERAPSIHEDQHVQFDDTLNAAYEIGSEVEIFMDGEKQMPKKARSSLPSPYGEPGPAVAGGKKKKISEKQKDKAIRE